MASKKKSSPKPESAGNLAFALADFDYRVECDDFLLYELGRLIEEDRASLDEEEFRRLVDEGIQEHIETRLEIRADLAMRLRQLDANMAERMRPASARVLQLIEDIELPLRQVELVVRTYTAYLFHRLEECVGDSGKLEHEARNWIERWQRGEVLGEEMSLQLKQIGGAAVAAVADLLFDSPDDRVVAETALGILGSIRSPVSARILAHVISEPMMEEDLEMTAYALLKTMWPLPRHYIGYSLKAHTHEDIPFRWFQLLIESDDPAAADRILEEIQVHAENPEFREYLLALVGLLRQSRDPNLEEKLIQMVNSPETSRAAAGMIEEFVKQPAPDARAATAAANPWEEQAGLRRANKKYRAAARLFDAGRKAESLGKLDELLNEQPGYPSVLMLKRLI